MARPVDCSTALPSAGTGATLTSRSCPAHVAAGSYWHQTRERLCRNTGSPVPAPGAVLRLCAHFWTSSLRAYTAPIAGTHHRHYHAFRTVPSCALRVSYAVARTVHTSCTRRPHQPENPMSASSGILLSCLYLPLRAYYYHTSATCFTLVSLSSFTITHS